MRKFIYFLQDSPKRPFEINAVSKAEVKALITESVPDESHILAIYTEDEFNRKYNIVGNSNKTTNVINEEDDSEYNERFSNSQDFFNSMLNSVEQNSVEQKCEETKVSQNVVAEQKNTIQYNKKEVTYFEDDGISFKLENGKLYRKRWRNIKDSPDKIEYRILRAKTGKECDKDQFDVEILDWVEFQQK